MRKLIQGMLYATVMDLYIDNNTLCKGSLVVYIEKDKRYANSHWVLLPNGRKGTLWSGHLEEICK